MIRTFGLTKRYGNVLALDNLNLEVKEGEIFGYIGPNGAGKTTTLKILATLLAPTSGRAEIGGVEVGRHSREIRPIIGYMPDFFGVYEDMTVDEYLTFFAAAYKLKGQRRQRIVNEVMELTDHASKRDTLCEAPRRRMHRRPALARQLARPRRRPSFEAARNETASGTDPRRRPVEARAPLLRVRAPWDARPFRDPARPRLESRSR